MATKKVPIEIEGTDPTMVGWQTGIVQVLIGGGGSGKDTQFGGVTRDGWDGITQEGWDG
jgi:hypothetical protein